MREVTDPAVAAALRELAREDPRLAEAANAGLNSLTWDRGLESITRHGLQEWLWHELPVKLLTEEDAKLEQAEALARLLELVGLPRYAALCTSPTTREIISAYEHDESAGRAAYRKAMTASGVVPPDVPELAWGDVMGGVEVAAYYACASALELAIDAGTFAPGARGWRTAQQTATRAHLLRPRAELGGECWLDRVLGERVERWLGSPGTERRELLDALGDALLGPAPPPPPDAAARIAPVRWLLEHAADGIELTQTDRLRPPVVTAFATSFGWYVTAGKRRLEDDVPEVSAARDLAHRIAAVRRAGRRLVLTAAGRRLVDDTAALWQALSTHLVSDAGFPAAVEELALAAILTRTALTETDQVADAVAAVVAHEGWRDQNGLPPDCRVVRWTLTGLHWALEVLGLVEPSPDRPWPRSWRLNQAGRAAALAALRARATGPCRSLADAG